MFQKPQHPELHSAIVCYWFIQADNIPNQTKMLPDGYSDIMINLGEPYIVSNNEESMLVSGSCFFGQRTRSILLSQPGKVNMIGIRIMPGYEMAIMGLSAATMVDNIVPLRAIAPGNTEEAEELLKDTTKSVEDKLHITEALLLYMMRRHKVEIKKQLSVIVNKILACKGDIMLEELLDSEGVSYKQLERMFKKHLGLSPKLYLRICRFHHAFTFVRNKNDVDWIEVLVQCGYYDQSHFIRDFRFFAGLPPSKQLLKKDSLDDLFGFT